MSEESVTRWIERLRTGDSGAAEAIWRRYFANVVRLARQRLAGASRRAADEEDVALSALNSFYSGVANGRFPELADRDNLWRLLVVITARKAADHRVHEQRKKRGGDATATHELDELASATPSPELLAEMSEECERLFARLDDPALQQVALFKLEGWTTEEIAEELGCVARTVERKLNLIRKKWSGDG
jgi:RNA polymerase sigma factor (sigma-70 family)